MLEYTQFNGAPSGGEAAEFVAPVRPASLSTIIARIEQAVDELPGHRFAEELLDPGGAARRVFSGSEPQPAG